MTHIAITDEDAWTAFGTLGDVGSQLTKRLRENGNGYPGACSSMEEWEAILAEIEDGFRALTEQADDCGLVDGVRRARWEHGCTLLRQWVFDLWD